MIALDGLGSFTCESSPARVLTGVAILLDVLAFYFVITEVSLRASHGRNVQH